MRPAKTRSFMGGTLILVLSNLVVKVIGALFKIPLARLLTEEGMAIFNTAYQVYAALFAVSTTGLPVAISKLMAESVAQQNAAMCRKIYQVSFWMLALIGLLGSLILCLFAAPIASAVRDREAVYSILAIAPALFFICIASCYRGVFQGMQNMTPTAISQVIEAVGKLVFGYGIACFFMRAARIHAAQTMTSLSYEWPAAGAVLGITIGIVLSAVFLELRYAWFVQRRGFEKMGIPFYGVKLKAKPVVKRLLFIAVPVTLGACVSSMTAVVDMAMIRQLLQSVHFTAQQAQRLMQFCSLSARDAQGVFVSFGQGGFLNEEQARWFYGAYSGYAYPLVNLPCTVVMALSMSLVPAISAFLSSGNKPAARETAYSALRITFLFSLPCAVVLSMVAPAVLQLVYKNMSSVKMLRLLAPSCISITLVMVTTAILQASGHAIKPVINMAVGCGIKIICNYFLIRSPLLAILGAPISTGISYTFIMFLNVKAVKRVLGLSYSMKNDIVKPCLVAAIMGGILHVLSQILDGSKSIEALMILGFAGVCTILYLFLLIFVKSIVKKDIELLPNSKKIVKTLAKIGIID